MGTLTPTTFSAENEPRVNFKSQATLVQVPVVVTDKHGVHVRGLTREDFEVFENRKQQKVAAFEEVVASNTRLSPPPTAPGEFRNLVLDSTEPHTVMVIVMDMVNTPFLDQAYGRQQLIKYLANNVEPDRVLALVALTSRGLKVIHGLTSDPTQLTQAFKKVSGELPQLHGISEDAQAAAASGSVPELMVFGPGATSAQVEDRVRDFVDRGDADLAAFQQERAIETTMRGFLGIAWSLSGIPGRKSVVWATGGFPFSLDSPASVPGGYLSALYERAMQALNEAQISVYPIDVRGLIGPAGDISQRRPATLQQMSNRNWLLHSTQDTLRDFAAMTGGRAFYNTNDLVGSFQKVAADSSAYYVLAYYLDTTNDRPGWRSLKVKVRRSGTEVRARNGFLVTNATIDPDATRKTDLAYAVDSPFDSTGLPITLRWRGVYGTGQLKKVEFALNLPGTSLAFGAPENNKQRVSLDFYAVATKEGKIADQVTQTVEGALSPESMAKIKTSMNYQNDLKLPPGQYKLRVVVRDNLSGRIGSVSAPLTVN
jgi:VWFA-related protein